MKGDTALESGVTSCGLPIDVSVVTIASPDVVVALPPQRTRVLVAV